MKKVSGKMAVVLAAAVLACSSCSTWTNTGKGAAIGAGSGVAAGAGLGAIIGGGKGAVIGAAVGGVVGTAAGAAIGKKMDRQAAELESQLGDEARVETVTDQNNLQAIRVTFDSGILFDTGKSELSSSARASLAKFAASVRNNPQTDITVYGHTDNTGSRAVNERLSLERATAVANNLVGQGISRDRIKTEGLAYDAPIADNSTAEGRAANRRVEVYITASEDMIRQAQDGQL